jgi:peptide/nickel transport system ATP-binding protein
MSDRMVVMQKGKIEEMGDPDEIYLNPKSEYTKKLIESIPNGSLENIKAAVLDKKNKLASSN